MSEGAFHGSKRRISSRRPLYAPVQLHAESVRIPVPSVVIDISGGGCSISARMMLRAFENVHFDLLAHGGRPLHLAGKITRVRYNDRERMFHYGITFDKEYEDVMRVVSEAEDRAMGPLRKPR